MKRLKHYCDYWDYKKELKGVLKAEGTFKDFEDWYLKGRDADVYLVALDSIKGSIPKGYVFSGEHFSLKDFQKVSKCVRGVKFSISKNQWTAWGTVHRMNLNAVDNFDVMLLDANNPTLSNKSLYLTDLPDGADLRKVNLLGVSAMGTDFSKVRVNAPQLLSMDAREITPPEDMRLSEVPEMELRLYAHKITRGKGWKLDARHVNFTDLSCLERLDVGRLIKNSPYNVPFQGVTFPEYTWKPLKDMKGEPDEVIDDMTGCEFRDCDLSAIKNLSREEIIETAVLKNTIGPYGALLPDTPVEYSR